MSARADETLADGRSTLSAAALAQRVQRLARALREARPAVRTLGLLADNGADWVIADLAAELAGVPLVPLPQFFTRAQLQHAADACGMDALLSSASALGPALGFREERLRDGSELHWFRRAARPVALPAGTSKITFTSGTTGAPKGVCLSAAHQHAVAASLVEATRPIGIERHLALLPLPVLLENIAGVAAPLRAGASCIVPPLAQVGVSGATQFDAPTCLAAIERWQAHSVILLPQMLLALTVAIEAGAQRPASLRFAAVGGARVAPALIERARSAGVPAYEGYGLSECASVVALNVPGADRPGSVGRALPHARLSVASDGEVLVAPSAFLGYLGDVPPRDAWLRTGDIGSLDDDGFLTIEGRRKHQLITSFGRNVAPEWPEAELTKDPLIAQAAVFGEGRPQLSAVIVPRSPAVTDAALDAAVRAASQTLPGYARIAHWMRAAPFTVSDGLATPNGRIRRDAVWQRYGASLESLYEDRSGAAIDALL